MADVIIPATQYVLKDEKAYWLSEVNRQSPNSKGFRRYQIITVVRNDHQAQYWEDLGASKKWKGIDQFTIPSLMEHTVAELQYMANQLRRDKSPFDKKELAKVNKYRN